MTVLPASLRELLDVDPVGIELPAHPMPAFLGDECPCRDCLGEDGL